MNKELLDQLAPDEQPFALQLSSAAEDMHLSPNFQWKLETQLMDTYPPNKAGKQPSSLMKFMVPACWAILAVCGVLLLNWILRTLLPNAQVAAGATPTQAASFETRVRTGDVCSGPLAVSHGFDVFLSNSDKTGFVSLDAAKAIGELRSFAWSTDGKQLVIVGNTTGRGNIYLTNPNGSQLRPVLANSELNYLMDAAWSRDGKQFVLWSSQNHESVSLLSADGTSLVEKQLGMMVLSTPQFTPDGKSIIFYGADHSSAGLFEVSLDKEQIKLINALVEDETSFAFSPDGSRLAYIAMDRNSGVAILMIQDLETRAITALPGSLPIPKGSGSSIPKSANLSWSADGKSLVFDFGRGASERAIYLAHTDGTELVKLVDSAYAPAISTDGQCLAYISNKQVFLLELSNVSKAATTAPVLLADLPTGRSIADYRLDRLQWKP